MVEAAAEVAGMLFGLLQVGAHDGPGGWVRPGWRVELIAAWGGSWRLVW
ncbi:MAG: hypothetical protein ACRDQ6_16030 [Pseudonocardiaceae bacterium]